MVFVVKKVNKKTYAVCHRFSGVTKAERSSHAAAERIAAALNKQQAQAGAAFAYVDATWAGK